MRTKLSTICLLAIFISVGACKKDKPEAAKPAIINTIPEFYIPAIESDYGITKPEVLVIANAGNQIDTPQDLDFNTVRPNEMWIVNKGKAMYGGNVIIIKNPSEPGQSYLYRRDAAATHFMLLPSAIAFSNNGNWASSANVLDANHSGGRYTGPTLWSGDLNIFAQPSGGNGSHLDMVHQSPYTMGIAAEKDNAFWVFDGYYNNIIRYDFVDDHGPGNDYHGDARLRRYTEVRVKREPNVPSHLVLDKAKKWLYIVDGGNKKIIRMDITTGSVLNSLPPVNEAIAEYSRMSGVFFETFADQNMQMPSGIDIIENRLFISDYETGDIICYDVNSKQEIGRVRTEKPGITGIKIYNGKLWYVNAREHTCNVIKQK